MNVRSVLIALLVFYAISAHGQQTDLLMGRWHASRLEEQVLKTKSMVHLGSKPVLLNRKLDTISYAFMTDSMKYYSQLAARVMRDHLFQLKGKDYHISGDLLVDYRVGREFELDSASRGVYMAVRGIVLQGEIGKRFSFTTGFYEAQNYSPRYLRQFVDSNEVFPGWGRVKLFKENGYDYSKSFGKVGVDIFSTLHAELGYGNHFIGNGYRSLLMTDGLMNAPYVELDWRSRNGIFQYRTWYSTLQSQQRLPLGDTPESLFKRKSGHFHYLSIKPANWLEFGVFEGMISQRVTDSTVVKQPWNAFQPLIGVNTLIANWDGEQNVYAGFQMSVQFERWMVYSQYLVDDPASKRIGVQVGAKFFSLFLKGLDLQVEYNQTGAYTYAGSSALYGLNQVNQPLGHPLAGGVEEWIGIAEYRYGRVFARTKFNSIRHAVGEKGKWDADLDAETLEEFARIQQLECQVGYQLNLKTNAEIVFGYTYREGSYVGNTYLIGIRTNLHNNYFDF
ncbi:MAG: hypothetical protein ACOYLH_00640 [Flavobacteriales bacterium]